MRRRCPDSKLLEVGCLKGYRLDFTHYSSDWSGGVADIIVDPNNEVWGLIYKLSEEDIHRLDYYEGYPDIYTRFQTSIKTLTGSILDVWAYTVVRKNNFTPPTKAYMKIIKNATVEHQFPEAYRSYIDTIETR